MAATFHNVFAGAKTGLLKGIDVNKKVFTNLNQISELNREKEIKLMCWEDEKERKILLGQKNQIVRVYDVNLNKFVAEKDVSGGEGGLIGLHSINDRLLTCIQSGLVKIFEKNDLLLEATVGDNIEKMRLNKEKNHLIATGGNENDLKIWDLNRMEEAVFKAKNVRHDFLNLRVPVCVKDLQFIPNSEKVVVSTGHHQIRVYDPSTPQRRPVIEMEFGEYPLTSLEIMNDINKVIVGNCRGSMAQLDLRKKLLVHRYKGFAGGIRCIQCHPILPIVASCGLDRFLRIHNVNTHKLLHSVYLKSPLNCLLLSTTRFIEIKQEVKEEDQDVSVDDSKENDSDNELWDEMEVVGEKTRKRKHKKESNKRKIKVES